MGKSRLRTQWADRPAPTQRGVEGLMAEPGGADGARGRIQNGRCPSPIVTADLVNPRSAVHLTRRDAIGKTYEGVMPSAGFEPEAAQTEGERSLAAWSHGDRRSHGKPDRSGSSRARERSPGIAMVRIVDPQPLRAVRARSAHRQGFDVFFPTNRHLVAARRSPSSHPGTDVPGYLFLHHAVEQDKLHRGAEGERTGAHPRGAVGSPGLGSRRGD